MSKNIKKILIKKKFSSGVTLIELMIALFVFAIGMMAVTAMCLMSIHGNSLVNRTTQANFLAQSEMEKLLSERDKAVLCEYAVNGISSYNTMKFLIEPQVVIVPSYNTTADCEQNECEFWITVFAGWSDSKGSHNVELKTLARGE